MQRRELLREPVRGGIVERGLDCRSRLRQGRLREIVNAAARSRTATTIQDTQYRRPLTGRSIEPERARRLTAGGGEGLGNGAAIVGRAYPRLMSNPATILLVDDEEAVQKLLACPSSATATASCRRRGDEALRQFEHPVDLVVLDLMLPKLDGLEVCKRLREVSRVPIIMLTARDDEVDKVLGLELGADDYITKPFSIREFRSRVKAALRRAAAPSTTPTGSRRFPSTASWSIRPGGRWK